MENERIFVAVRGREILGKFIGNLREDCVNWEKARELRISVLSAWTIPPKQ